MKEKTLLLEFANLLLLTAFPFSGVATANHCFSFYPILCIFYGVCKWSLKLIYLSF